jgi:tellurite resistance protein TerB
MVLRRLLHPDTESVQLEPGQPAAPPPTSETESIRRISGELEALPLEQRRFVAGFAYVLARAAHADLTVSEAEVSDMEREIVAVGHLSEPQAALVVEMARHMNELYGPTDDFIVTRDWAGKATKEQREGLLRAAFTVASRDAISAEEVAELNEIGKELLFPPDEVDAIRFEFRDQLAAIQAMRAARSDLA